jgi:hypothetical protein
LESHNLLRIPEVVQNLQINFGVGTSSFEIVASSKFILMLIGFLDKLAGSRKSGSQVMFEECGYLRGECFAVESQ